VQSTNYEDTHYVVLSIFPLIPPPQVWIFTSAPYLLLPPTYEEYYLLGCDAVYFSRSLSKNRMLSAFSLLVACFAYSATVKMGAVPSSETLVNFYETPRRNIREDSTLHRHRRENPRSGRQSMFFPWHEWPLDQLTQLLFYICTWISSVADIGYDISP
jgi:hypothetical protein